MPLTVLLLAPSAARVGLPAAAAALAFTPTRALACCGRSRPVVVPSSGAPLPPSPTLYVFSPDSGPTTHKPPPPRVTVTGANGARLKHRLSEISQPYPVQVYRLNIESGSASRVNVKVAFNTAAWAPPPLEQHYPIDKAWSRPERSAVTIVDAKEHVWRPVCARIETQRLTVAGEAARQASAYRVAWASPDGGSSGSVMLPLGQHQLVTDDQRPEAPPELRAIFGLPRTDCRGVRVFWGDEPVDLRVTALFPDGSESAPSERAFRLSPPGDRAEPPPPPPAAPLAAPAEPVAEPTADAPPPTPFAIDPKHGALAALGTFVTAAVAAFFWRRQKR